MKKIVEVRESSDSAQSVAEFAEASLGKSFVSLSTHEGLLDIQFLGFDNEFVIVAETKEGLGVIILLNDVAKRDTRPATIILNEKVSY